MFFFGHLTKNNSLQPINTQKDFLKKSTSKKHLKLNKPRYTLFVFDKQYQPDFATPQPKRFEYSPTADDNGINWMRSVFE